MRTIPIEQAQEHLSEIVGRLSPGEEVVLTKDERPVARLVAASPRPGPGLCKGLLTIVADDDEHLKDFAEYMP